MALIVYAQRNITPEAYDTALIDHIESLGHTVQVETGTLASIDWSAVDLLIIGAPGTGYTAHVDGADLIVYGVSIISMCRHTSRFAINIGDGSAAATVSTFTRVEDEDPRAIFSSVTSSSVTAQQISSLVPGATLIYHNGTAGAAGVAEHIRQGISLVHWGYHRFDVASENMLLLFSEFLPPPPSITIDAIEDDDIAAFALKFMPPGGFIVTVETAEDSDTANFSATFYPAFFVAVSADEDDDAVAFAAENRWDDAADRRASRIIYRCYIEAEGYDRIEVPISSWQATLQTGRSSYVQAVVPAAAALYPAIAARAAGEFAIYRGARFDSGLENLLEMARAPVGIPVLNRGPQRATVTLSGYTTAYADLPAGEARTLTAIRSLSISSGLRVRCAIDWRLRPGSTATAGASSFTVAYINYYVGGTDSYMDVGERAL